MKGSIDKFHSLAIDTNIFVYYLNRYSALHSVATQLFKTILGNKIHIFTSIITLTELLSLKAPEPMIKSLEQELWAIPNFQIIEVNREIAVHAAYLRRKHNPQLADAIQLATAIQAKAQAFITNDRRLKKIKEIKVLVLDEFKK